MRQPPENVVTARDRHVAQSRAPPATRPHAQALRSRQSSPSARTGAPAPRHASRRPGSGCSVSRAMAISSSRNSTSPSSAYSSAVRSEGGVSCATCAITQPLGIAISPRSACNCPQRREQGGFASAIGVNDPDLAAGVDGDVGAVDERRTAAGKNQVDKAKHGVILPWRR